MEKVLILLAKILADKKTRDKVLIFIGSIVVGFLLLLAAPIIAIYTLGNVEIEPPEIDRNTFNESAFIEQLSPGDRSRADSTWHTKSDHKGTAHIYVILR